jgi:hypothetical protein
MRLLRRRLHWNTFLQRTPGTCPRSRRHQWTTCRKCSSRTMPLRRRHVHWTTSRQGTSGMCSQWLRSKQWNTCPRRTTHTLPTLARPCTSLRRNCCTPGPADRPAQCSRRCICSSSTSRCPQGKRSLQDKRRMCRLLQPRLWSTSQHHRPRSHSRRAFCTCLLRSFCRHPHSHLCRWQSSLRCRCSCQVSCRRPATRRWHYKNSTKFFLYHIGKMLCKSYKHWRLSPERRCLYHNRCR